MNLSIVVGGKSFWYTFDDNSWKFIVEKIIEVDVICDWVEVKDDYFRISEVQAVLHWKSK
jgi:hypothetical protein